MIGRGISPILSHFLHILVSLFSDSISAWALNRGQPPPGPSHSPGQPFYHPLNLDLDHAMKRKLFINKE